MKTEGFNLIEVILAVLVIGILAGIVWGALNPGDIFSLINSSRADNNIKVLDKAFENYAIDNQGNAAEVLALKNNNPYLIVNGAGTYNSPMNCAQAVGDVNTTTIDSIVPDYLPTIPVNENVSDPGDEGSGYYVVRKGAEVRVGSCFGDYDFDTGLVGLWHMDESVWTYTANIVADSSGNANHGTPYPNGSIPQTNPAAKVGSFAGDFDGIDDYVRAADSLSLRLPDTWTISVWVKFDDITKEDDWRQGIISRAGENFYIWYRTYVNPASNRLYIGFKNNGVSVWSDHYIFWYPDDLNQWYHLVYTFNNSTNAIRLYINGETMIDTTDTDDPEADSQWLYFGITPENFDGKLDDIAIWNREFSTAEVRALYTLQR